MNEKVSDIEAMNSYKDPKHVADILARGEDEPGDLCASGLCMHRGSSRCIEGVRLCQHYEPVYDDRNTFEEAMADVLGADQVRAA